jgi:hypothetical protein
LGWLGPLLVVFSCCLLEAALEPLIGCGCCFSGVALPLPVPTAASRLPPRCTPLAGHGGKLPLPDVLGGWLTSWLLQRCRDAAIACAVRWLVVLPPKHASCTRSAYCI